MPSKKDVAVIRASGIDTGKNTLHMVGLKMRKARSFCAKRSPWNRIAWHDPRNDISLAAPDRDRSRHGHALHVP